MRIRSARPDDIPDIASWTGETFDWGDYVADRLGDWIDDPNTEVLVADDDGLVTGVVCGIIVGPGEAWAQGARTHPDHRRRGIATALSTELWSWARERDAAVVRLAVEEDNEPAAAQVESMGFRPVSRWLRGGRAVGEGSPVPEGNGGKRVTPSERLAPANSAESEPAFLSWSSGELGRAARGLAPEGWTWRRLTIDQLVAAAKSRDLYEGRPGWALVRERESALDVDWIETAPGDSAAMAHALVDLASEGGYSKIRAWTPAIDWLSQGLERLGFEFFPVRVWELPL